MSRAFIKEDVDVIERTTRRRSQSGLPPGALNYMTPQGADSLRERLEGMKQKPESDSGTIEHLEQVLESAILVAPGREGDSVSFGASVTVMDSGGKRRIFRVVGADEVDLDPDNVSWISPIGKTLLAARRGQRITLPGSGSGEWTIVSID